MVDKRNLGYQKNCSAKRLAKYWCVIDYIVIEFYSSCSFTNEALISNSYELYRAHAIAMIFSKL